MSPEQYQYNQIELLFNLPSAEFSRICDSLVDYQIPQTTLVKTVDILNTGRNIILVTNHQSYFEIETQRYFCQQLNQISEKFINAYLLYSSPAVESNIGGLLRLRDPVYQRSGLNILGIIRESDYQHPKYQKYITPEIESKARTSLRTFTRALRGSGNLIIVPFEATLEGGRINPNTGQVNGMQSVNEETCLDTFIKRNSLLLPCGIDGSYKLINPNSHQPSPDFIQAIFMHPSKKPVTFKIGDFIDPASQLNLGFTSENITHQTIVEVAKLISPQARGAYSQYVSA